MSNKITYAERIELEKIEARLEELESEKGQLSEALSQCGDDHEKLMKLGKQLEVVMNELDTKTDRWVELSEREE